MKRVAIAIAFVLTGLLLFAGCGGSDQTQGTEPSADSPVGTYVSTSDVHGEGSAFSNPVTVSIGESDIGWTASCNRASAKGVEITADQLMVNDAKIVSTLMGCPPKYQQQDEDLAAFFGSDPTWQLDGDRLTLSNDSVTVVLTATTPHF